MSKARRLLEQQGLFDIPQSYEGKKRLVNDILQRNQGNIDIIYLIGLLQDSINNSEDWKEGSQEDIAPKNLMSKDEVPEKEPDIDDMLGDISDMEPIENY